MTAPNIQSLSKPEIAVLISQLEYGMSNVIASGDEIKAYKLNKLIGDCIDIYNS